MTEATAAATPPPARARAELDAGRARILEDHRGGASGEQVVRAISDLTDEVLAELYAALVAEQPGPPPRVALVALGGYGRRELAPRSDVDLLALLPPASVLAGDRKRAEGLAESLHRALWDAGIEAGFAARSLSETLSVAADDHTIRTAILDCRLVCGDASLFEGLQRAAVTELEARRVEEFIADKLEEFRTRRERYGGSVWLLEPHLKQGKGGLRDLHTALWIARARHKVAGLGEAGEKGLLPAAEIAAARDARAFLFRLRNELHYTIGRRDDRLTFDNQRKLAASLGYKDGEHELGVERLMREAYTAMLEISRAADAMIDRCAVEDAPRAEARGLAALLRRTPAPRPIDAAFQLVNERIGVVDNDVFARRPADLVRIFAVAETYGAQLASHARDLVVREVERLGPRLATDREAHRELWEILTREGSDGWALSPMHELQVLGALFPEIARLRARVQHDVYHVYTVDTHTVVALQRLLKLRAGGIDSEPQLTRIARAHGRPLALALGLFFHDLGKGMGSDHSRRGAELVRGYAARVGLEEQDARDAEWLVLQHLKASQISQRRDLEDHAMIEAFARECGTVERLEMLYLLTYCDMASVAPENWTAWKAQLLGQLYEKANAALIADGLDAPAHAQAVEERRLRLGAELRKSIKELDPALIDEFVHAAPERYLAVTAADAVCRHVQLWREARRGGFAAGLHRPPSGEAVLTLVARDRPGLLALFTAALAANGIDILSAEVASLAGALALDQFHVREPGGGAPSQRRWETARTDLGRLLAGEEDPKKLVQKRLRRATWATSAAPEVQTKIRIDNVSSEKLTVLDVFTQDRPGLLHAIAEALHDAGVSIELARVATEGNKATDAFYLREEPGSGGGKITDPVRLEQLELAVVSAIDAHASGVE